MAPSQTLLSLVWFTPEHEMTLHSFGYGSDITMDWRICILNTAL